MAFELPFSAKTPPLIGLDIGSSSVKLVELSDVGGALRLERYAIEPLPRAAVVDGNIDKIDVVAEAVNCFATLEKTYPNSPLSVQVPAILRRLQLVGKQLEFAGPTVGTPGPPAGGDSVVSPGRPSGGGAGDAGEAVRERIHGNIVGNLQTMFRRVMVLRGVFDR